MASFSITGAGVRSCSGSCLYCSAASTAKYSMGINKKDVIQSLIDIDNKTATEFRADFGEMEKTLDNDPQIINEMKKDEDKRYCHVDMWMGDPVTCFQNTQEVVEFLKDYMSQRKIKLNLSSSTNGLPLIRDEICQYYKENNIRIQLSHDGIGQWMRTGDIDPLYDERFAPNLADMFCSGIMSMINCTTNFWNPSLLDNKRYWDDYFKSIPILDTVYQKMYIKLNRIYDSSDYDIHTINKDGKFGRRTFEELKTMPLGNMNLRNWKNANTGNVELDHLLAHVLDDVMSEWLQIAILIRDERIQNSLMWKPYLSYFREQFSRHKYMKSRDSMTGACRAFQRWKHQIGDSSGWKKTTFVIDTLGRYSECNLLDADTPTKNPGGLYEPEACKKCKYYLHYECMGCGSEPINDECEWHYRWAALLDNVARMDSMLKYKLEKK